MHEVRERLCFLTRLVKASVARNGMLNCGKQNVACKKGDIDPA